MIFCGSRYIDGFGYIIRIGSFKQFRLNLLVFYFRCNFKWTSIYSLAFPIHKCTLWVIYVFFFVSWFFKMSLIYKNTINTFFKIFIIHKPSLWSRDVPQKFGPDRFSRFDVYWTQTDRQTDRQTNRQTSQIYM